LARIVGIPDDRVAVIPNAYSEVFSGAAAVPPGVPPDGVIRVLTIANPYPHKNLPIIPSIAKALEALAPEREFRFIVTLPEGGEEVMRFWRAVDRLGVRDMIENVGRLRLDECPAWYSKASIVLLPTLLETFSATYPEAMKMGRPIVTPDLDFAHDICADAAIFYPPLSARKAAEAIRQLVADPDLYRTMVERGYEQLKRFPSPEQKYEMQLAWLEQVARAGGDTGVIGRPRR
jgi:glycosyltransferase involved in cell wall biosynthesis